MIPSNGNFDIFGECVDLLSKECSDHSVVEVLVKIEDPNLVSRYDNILNKHHFANTKILCYPLSGYNNIGHFFNSMAESSQGDLFFVLCDDGVVHGDWVADFMGSRGKFRDNIYALNTRNHPWTPYPVISREWFNFFGYLTPKLEYMDRFGNNCSGYAPIDTWIQNVASAVGRYKKTKISVSTRNVRTTVNSVPKILREKMRRKIKKEVCKLKGELKCRGMIKT